MVKSAKNHVEEEEGDDEEELLARHDSVSYKGDGKSGEQKANNPRSKHSETEQRRRSKINERFQILRDLIPQNDQKRDKASLLLEVIEYIQFLQEKVHMYEGSYEGWSRETTKLMPWRNHHGRAESFVDQAMKNGSGHDNNFVISPALLTSFQNSVESDFGVAEGYKAMVHLPGPATQPVSLAGQMQQNMFSPIGNSSVPNQALQGSVSDVENMASQPQSQSFQGRSCTLDCAVTNNLLNEQEELTIEGGSVSISSAYSQGILNSLTKAMQSSGVDLSQASISVQIDVGKRSNNGLTTIASGSEEHENPSPNIPRMATGIGNCDDNYYQAHKRLRSGTS